MKTRAVVKKSRDPPFPNPKRFSILRPHPMLHCDGDMARFRHIPSLVVYLAGFKWTSTTRTPRVLPSSPSSVHSARGDSQGNKMLWANEPAVSLNIN